jgi:hypothetical protein
MLVVRREDVSPEQAAALAADLASVDWSSLHHAYGPASEVGALLLAIAIGGNEVRREAWWELWGNVHHQATVYEATVPAVSFIAVVARWPGHPDRIEALNFLREIALGNGTFAEAVHLAVRAHAVSLLDNWTVEPEHVQRALLWLSSAYPDLAQGHPGLTQLVPESMRVAWSEALDSRGRREDLDEDDFDALMDRQSELEAWALAGWPTE